MFSSKFVVLKKNFRAFNICCFWNAFSQNPIFYDQNIFLEIVFFKKWKNVKKKKILKTFSPYKKTLFLKKKILNMHGPLTFCQNVFVLKKLSFWLFFEPKNSSLWLTSREIYTICFLLNLHVLSIILVHFFFILFGFCIYRAILCLLITNFASLTPQTNKIERNKLAFLSYMVNKLCQCILGRREPDDRDNFGNKRLDIAGPLMAALFRLHWAR
jgi:DNA-directed RNA polymerase beta subunit